MGTSLTLTAHPQLSFRGSPLHSLSLDGRIFVIDMSTGLVLVDDGTVVQLGPSLDIPLHDTKRFSLSRSIWLCYLEVSGEEGKLAKGWCVTV